MSVFCACESGAHFFKCLLNIAEIPCGHVLCANTVFVFERGLDGAVTTVSSCVMWH